MFFRKASFLSEIGWEFERGFLDSDLPPSNVQNRGEARCIPLHMSLLARNLKAPDPGRLFPIFYFGHFTRIMTILSEVALHPLLEKKNENLKILP